MTVLSGNSPNALGTSPGFLSILHQWIATADHKKLGVMYVTSGLIFFLIGGLEAAMMRWQLAMPESTLLSPSDFNRLFTMHGTTMVFLVGMPILLGVANYFVPLQIGARDLAFPRLNAFGFWLFLFGGILLYFSYFGAQGLYGMGSAPDVGWFAYAPLTERTFSRGHSTDYWILGLLVSSFGSIATGINLITTILTMRCPGMTLMKMPMLVWLMLVDAILIMIAMPPLAAAQVMLLFDRLMGAHFFDTQAGGSAILWQNLFWFFGHPEVYILILPAFAYVSEIIPVFCRKVIFGYPLMVAATVSIGFISLGVWVHHLFALGLSPMVNTIFMGSTMLIAIPTGIKMFNWVGTMVGGKIRFDTPMLYATGFLALFLIGGLTGIMLAVVPFDWQVSDSYFVVGHFHYVLFGGTDLRDLRRDLLLVPEGDRPDAQREDGQVAVLAALPGIQPDLRTDARLGHARHASPHLHLPRRSWMGPLEHALIDRRAHPDRRRDLLRMERAALALQGPQGRGRSMGRMDTRMGHHVTTAGIQLRGDAQRLQPPPAVGHQASRGSRLEV